MSIDASFVRDEGAQFALRIMEMLARVLPSGDLGFTATATIRGDEAFVAISQVEELGLQLTIRGRDAARLAVGYRCVVSSGSRMLAVLSSEFKLFVETASQPLFSVDYVRDARENTPAAHWNVYANRRDVSQFLSRAGAARRGDANRRAARTGRAGLVGELHFPVGGHRFRPCLEDVLDMLWAEFSIDVRSTAREALDEGRRDWRRRQLGAAVSDDPHTAATELRRLGVDVGPLPDSLTERQDRTTAL